jgi:hypothetical protein
MAKGSPTWTYGPLAISIDGTSRTFSQLKQNRASSWSWACVDGPVVYPDGFIHGYEIQASVEPSPSSSRLIQTD